jgi:hypothetical protein
VFTSFTLSQAGMIRHWLAEGRKGQAAARGWRRSIVINAVGATTTAIVLVVVVLSKFRDGAWLSIIIMALLVPMFYGIHRHYAWVRGRLLAGVERPGAVGRHHVVLLVKEVTAATAEALGYVRSFRPDALHAVTPGEVTPEKVAAWEAFAGGAAVKLEPLGRGSPTAAIRRFVRALGPGPDDFVTLLVPELVEGGLLRYLVVRRDLVRLKASLLREARVVVTDVPVVVHAGRPQGVDARPLIPTTTTALIFVSAVNDLTIRAVNYAHALRATTTRAIYFDLDPEQAHRLEEAWFDAQLGVPLDIVEAPFRDLSAPMLAEVRRFTERPDAVVNVIIPEAIVTKWWQFPLHNQNALFIKRLFLMEDRVILSSVPWVLRPE